MIKKLLILLAIIPLTQCSMSLQDEIKAIDTRNAVISKEKAGDYYVGRRYYIPAVRFWGYIRKPQEPWSKAQLVILEESRCLSPDRLPEATPGKTHGYDKNYEYKINGRFTGKSAYEPNTNLKLPVFQITGYELLNDKPGWLFRPNERYSEDTVSLRPAITPVPSR